MCNKTIGLTTNRASGKSPTWPVTSLFVRQDFHHFLGMSFQDTSRYFHVLQDTSIHVVSCWWLLLPFANDVPQLASILRFTIYGESARAIAGLAPDCGISFKTWCEPGLEHEKKISINSKKRTAHISVIFGICIGVSRTNSAMIVQLCDRNDVSYVTMLHHNTSYVSTYTIYHGINSLETGDSQRLLRGAAEGHSRLPQSLGFGWCVSSKTQKNARFLAAAPLVSSKKKKWIPSGELTVCNGKIHHFIAGKIHYFYSHFPLRTVAVHQRVVPVLSFLPCGSSAPLRIWQVQFQMSQHCMEALEVYALATSVARPWGHGVHVVYPKMGEDNQCERHKC